MRLFFLRHGDAEDPGPGQSDAERRLTPAGHAEMREVAVGIRSLNLGLTAILTSPRVRARETADWVARGLQAEGLLREEPRLGGGCRIGSLQSLLEPYGNADRILLVGHEPDFSLLVGDLIGGGLVRVPKASLIRVDLHRVEPGGGELRWHLLAEHLARLGDRNR
ncbi:MAG: hypothetical protein FJX77_15720 [Armatimonadetes bacterium]|nr:hypothetical protein [Armatimonadota bacterium]